MKTVMDKDRTKFGIVLGSSRYAGCEEIAVFRVLNVSANEWNWTFQIEHWPPGRYEDISEKPVAMAEDLISPLRAKVLDGQRFQQLKDIFERKD